MFNSFFHRKDEEERVREAGRLPPGQSLTQKFPVLHYGPVPSFDPKTWDLRIYGEVEEEVRWTWAEFQQLPRTSVQLDLHCVTRWSKFGTTWEGVSVRSLVDQGLIKLKPTAQYVMQHAEYGFTVNLPLEVVLAENFLLATHFNGEPITPDHGYPLRGVIGKPLDRDDLNGAVFVERGQVAAGAGVHAPRSARLLGAGRLSQPGRCVEGTTFRMKRVQVPR